MDINALKKRLGEISNKNKKTTNIWKPTPGQQNVRIVPNKSNPDNPFLELKFHYDFNNKTYLSPISFDRPDPIVELANHLRNSGDQDEYQMSTKLYPKMRIYVPVIVRGEEDKGVRFWGFGKQVYQALLTLIADDEYGDITDLKEGTDITVEYIPKEETGKSFPETKILPRRKPSPVGDEKVLEAVKNQPLISEIYTEPTYDELKDALEKYLAPEDEADENEESDSSDAYGDAKSETSDTAETKTESKEPETKSTSVADTSDAFDKIFNS